MTNAGSIGSIPRRGDNRRQENRREEIMLIDSEGQSPYYQLIKNDQNLTGRSDESIILSGGTDFREVSINLKKFDNIIEQIEDLRFLRGRISDLEERLVQSQKFGNPDTFAKNNLYLNNLSADKFSKEMVKNGDPPGSDGGGTNIAPTFDSYTEKQTSYRQEENYEQDSSLDTSDLAEYGPIKTRLPSPRSHPYSTDWSMKSSVKGQVAGIGMNFGKQLQHHQQQQDQQQQWPNGMLFGSSAGQTSSNDKGINNKHRTATCDEYPVPNNGWLSTEKDMEKSVFDGSERPKEATPIPSIVVDEHAENNNDCSPVQSLKILSQGTAALQGGHVFSDTSNNSIPSPTASSKTWVDSPLSCYNNVVTSRPNSRCSSRAQSPGSGMQLDSQLMPSNVSGSPLGSPQVSSTYFNPSHSLASPSSSNQSYGDTPSPSNYQSPLNQRIEEQLHEDLACFSILGAFNNEQRNVVNNNNRSNNNNNNNNHNNPNIVVTGFDSNELQLVEEVLRDLGGKYEAPEEAQVVPNSRYANGNAANFEEQSSGIHIMENNLKRVSSEQVMTNQRQQQNFNVSSSSSSSSSTNYGNGNLRVPSAYSSSSNNFLYSFGSLQESNYGDDNFDQTREYEYDNYRLNNNVEMRYVDSQIDRTHHQQSVDQFNRSVPSLVGMEVTSNENFETKLSTSLDSSMLTKQGRRRCYSGSELSPELTFNDFQIPEMVTSFKPRRTRKTTERKIVPWPSLNLPSVQASKRLQEGLNPKEVEKAMISLLKRPVEELARADEDGDTMLMCLVGNPEELATKKAYLVPLVERLSNVKGALSVTNNRGEDALYLAAMNCPDMSYIAGYLAATMLQKGIDINQRLYHTRGDTLIHSVAARGDSHGEVLAELLALKTVQGNAVFDLSKRNYDGRTALHVAVESHDSTGQGPKAVATVRLLLENGADPNIKETKCGDTALHMAAALTCDPALVKVLLEKTGATAVNTTNYNYNTPLHMAAAVSTAIPLERQREVCWLLTQAGAQSNIQNRQGKTPLALVAAGRKDAIKRIFYKKC